MTKTGSPRGRPKKNPIVPEAKPIPHLTEEQILALKRVDHAMAGVISSYRNLMQPDYGEVVELDNAFIMFQRVFCEEIHKND